MLGRSGPAAATLLTIACVCGSCGSGSPQPLPDAVAEAQANTTRYCGYGATSRAQAISCTKHVTWQEIERRALRQPTNAALYGIGELNTCLADSGPFCRDETLAETMARVQRIYSR